MRSQPHFLTYALALSDFVFLSIMATRSFTPWCSLSVTTPCRSSSVTFPVDGVRRNPSNFGSRRLKASIPDRRPSALLDLSAALSTMRRSSLVRYGLLGMRWRSTTLLLVGRLGDLSSRSLMIMSCWVRYGLEIWNQDFLYS